MVRTWIADITPLLMEETYQEYYQKLPTWRKKKADQHRYARDKAQSVGVWSLWENVKKECDVSESAVYNLSHSGNYVLCAYTNNDDAKLGCDLEEVKAFREAVARRFFCPREYEHIMSKKEPERTQLFYRYWVLKESFMKATRRGMALDMHSYEIGWDQYHRPVLCKQPEEFLDTYYYKEYFRKEVNAGIAICTTDPEIDEELHTLPL